jgi:hypothetical protein
MIIGCRHPFPRPHTVGREGARSNPRIGGIILAPDETATKVLFVLTDTRSDQL